MSVSYGTGDRGRATRLHAELVRRRGRCERCGKTTNLQCAHIVSRRYANTRTDLDNAFCLCAGCHRYFTEWPVEFHQFVESTIGIEKYAELRTRALSRDKVDWSERIRELKALT